MSEEESLLNKRVGDLKPRELLRMFDEIRPGWIFPKVSVKEPKEELEIRVPRKGHATFKAKLQKAGRITIPKPEMEYLGVSEGDLVQVLISKVTAEI